MIVVCCVLSLLVFIFCVFVFLVMVIFVWVDFCEGCLFFQLGQQFLGMVCYVGDGDGLCVGNFSDLNIWIEVCLVDFDVFEFYVFDGCLFKLFFEQVVFGQNVICEVWCGWCGCVIVFDWVIVVCCVYGCLIGDLFCVWYVLEGGN